MGESKNMDTHLKTVVEGNLFTLLNSSHALKFLTLPATYALLSYLDTNKAWSVRLKIFKGIKHKFIERTFELFLAETYLNLGSREKAMEEFKKIKFDLLKPYLYTDVVILSYFLKDFALFKTFLKNNLEKISEVSAIREMIFALLYGYVKTFDTDLSNAMTYLLNKLLKKDEVLYYQTLLDTCYRLSHNTLTTPENKKAVLMAYHFLSENQNFLEDIIRKRKRQGFDYLFVLTTFRVMLLQHNLMKEATKINDWLTSFTEKWRGDKEMNNILTTVELISIVFDNEDGTKVEPELDLLLDSIETDSRKFMDRVQASLKEKTRASDKELLVWYYNLVFGITAILLFIDRYKKGIEKYLFRSLRLVDYIGLPNTALNLLKEILLFAKLRSLIPPNEMYRIFEKYLSLSLGSSYYMKVKHTPKKIEESTVRDTAFAISQFSIFPEFLPYITFTLIELQRKFPYYALELANNGIRTILDGLRSLKLGKDLLMKPPFLV
ncbi:MAG: hypothetical protein J7L47_05760 [Candidatus Odinarchaeota archaeon]|nr:hypothetical protein [Candidatus Odinarchaeota archaeon]